MAHFDYIIDKIHRADFVESPFKYLYIENFFNQEDFELITSDKQINLQKYNSTEELIEDIQSKKYKPVPFPGCTTSVNEYLDWYNNSTTTGFHNDDLLEGFGMSMRLRSYANEKIQELMNFLNSDTFHNVIKEKFGKTKKTIVETAIQKYLSGYEISPHPDIRTKCLTYMININTDTALSEKLDLHTHFMSFKDSKSNIYDYWKDNTAVDRCWVPWDWCETNFQHVKNNSITMFAPDNNTLHAVKLKYDHKVIQRTQIYGNLWYDTKKGKSSSWKDLEQV